MWWMALIGMGMQAGGTIMQGRQAEKAAKLRKKQLEANASRTRVASQQVARDYLKESTLLESRARAVAAASGAGGDQVEGIIDDIGAAGEYRALMALYNGETTANTQKFAGEVEMFEGSGAKSASYLSAGSTIMTESADQWSRYDTNQQLRGNRAYG